ncbi:MAG: hypothetical protein HYY76_08770 [Acidobacteria bacterium]|nr:hypothetical protein [Acidobacteriota bacterium]
MGIYRRRFGDRESQIRITKRGNVYDVAAYVVQFGEPLPEPAEEIPTLPNEEAALDGMTRWLRDEYGPEPES